MPFTSANAAAGVIIAGADLASSLPCPDLVLHEQTLTASPIPAMEKLLQWVHSDAVHNGYGRDSCIRRLTTPHNRLPLIHHTPVADSANLVMIFGRARM